MPGVDFTNWAEGVGWHPGVDGAGVLTGTADSDGEQGEGTLLTQAGVFTLGELFKGVFTLSNQAAGTVAMYFGGTGNTPVRSADDTYTVYRYPATDTTLHFLNSTTFIGSIDDANAKQVTLASTLALVDLGYVEGRYKLTLGTVATGELAGIMIMADDLSTPTSYVTCIVDETTDTLECDKNVAGTFTNLISESITYVSGQILWIVWDASAQELEAYYNGSQIGSTIGITNAELIDSTIVGLILTGSAQADAVDFENTVETP